MIRGCNWTAVCFRSDLAAAIVFLHHRRSGRQRGFGEKQGDFVAGVGIEREGAWIPESRAQVVSFISINNLEAGLEESPSVNADCARDAILSSRLSAIFSALLATRSRLHRNRGTNRIDREPAQLR